MNYFHGSYNRIWNRLHTWGASCENLLFVTLILIQLTPIWTFKYFPSQDGPTHLENAAILREYHHPDRTVFRKYYLINTSNISNWFWHLVLAGIMHFVPMLIAEKILLSGYIVLLPVSVRYSLGAIKPNTKFLAFMSFPFVYNFPFHMGFYSFSYSLPMFFFIMGFWLKHREHFTPGKTLVLSILSLLTYFSHIVSLAMVCLGMILISLLDLLRDTRSKQGDIHFLWNVFKKRTRPLFLALLPTFLFVMTFLSQQGVEMFYGISILSRLKRLYMLYSLCSYDLKELWPSIVLVCLFALVTSLILVSKIRKRQFDVWDGLLLVICAYVLVYFTAPDAISGGTYMNSRLALYPFFALILWLGAQSYRKIMKLKIIIVSVGITLALLGLHVKKYAELNPYITEYLSGMHLIESNTTLLPLCFSPFGYSSSGRSLSRKVESFIHASSYIAAKRHVVEFNNYEAWKGHFPLIYRASLNPLKHIAIRQRIDAVPPEVDFLSYPKRAGGRVDYVLLWGVRQEFLNHKATKSIFEQLRQGYDLIFTSPNKGLIQLYRRQDF